MRQKEALDGAVEDNDLHERIGFECRDDLIQFWDAFRTKDIQWRKVERDAPVGGRTSFETDASGKRIVVHVDLRDVTDSKRRIICSLG